MKEMSPNILIIEDDLAVAVLVHRNLAVKVYRAEVGEDAEVMVDKGRLALVLTRCLRGCRTSSFVRRRSYCSGHTDPFVGHLGGRRRTRARREMTARVKALLRRSARRVADTLQLGDLLLDKGQHRVTHDSRQVHLSPTEFRLLAFFMENSGRVLPRQQLLEGVWGHDECIDGRRIGVHVGRLRKGQLDTNPIRTVRGAGYTMEGATATRRTRTRLKVLRR